ncbi:MAG TPA: LLM class flavin-dependent oxidoreductase [Phototrophicaceae bacterium]|nr:LLM class flavin-dependent oxidoreductase [Phototrophicaceae bacterium]
MKYALYLPNFGPFGDVRTLVNLARDAEAVGWDGFFLWDHIARQHAVGNVVDPWIALSAIALSTSSIKIGALITPLPRRRPWKVARETASLDQLSGGRLIFGAGIGGKGGQEVEWDNFGEVADLKVRGTMLDEGLDILTGLWSGDIFQYNGQHYQVKASQFLPAPAQSPRIPIWIAGYWRNLAPFRRAARWDGVFPLFNPELNFQQTQAQFREVVSYINENRTGNTPCDFLCRGHTSGHTSSEDHDLIAGFNAAGATWWMEDLMPEYYGTGWADTWHFDAMRERIRQGPPTID